MEGYHTKLDLCSINIMVYCDDHDHDHDIGVGGIY